LHGLLQFGRWHCLRERLPHQCEHRQLQCQRDPCPPLGSLNRIDGNTANHNSNVGILWANDLVIRNSAFLNTTANYSPAVGTGNTGPLNAAGTSTSPWANF